MQPTIEPTDDLALFVADELAMQASAHATVLCSGDDDETALLRYLRYSYRDIWQEAVEATGINPLEDR